MHIFRIKLIYYAIKNLNTENLNNYLKIAELSSWNKVQKQKEYGFKIIGFIIGGSKISLLITVISYIVTQLTKYLYH